MADDDLPIDFTWEELAGELNHPDLGPLQIADAGQIDHDANPADQGIPQEPLPDLGQGWDGEPYQPQQAMDFNPLPNLGQEDFEVDLQHIPQESLPDLGQDWDGEPYQPQQAMDFNPLPNLGQEDFEVDVQHIPQEPLPDLGQDWDGEPYQPQQAMDFNPLPNPGQEDFEVDLQHILQEPLPDLGQGWDVYVEPPAFENADVGNVQDAQNDVEMLPEIPVYNHDQLFHNLVQEKEEICRRMLGMLNRTSKQWLAYLNEPDGQLEHQNLIEVYAYLNHFIIDEEAPAPRHVRRNCNVDTDAATCCFIEKFGAFLEQTKNYPQAARQVKLFNMFGADTTRIISNILRRARLGKARTGLLPEHVHYIMEDWYTNRLNATENQDIPEDVEEAALVSDTGLSLYAVRLYQDGMGSRRYDFENQRMVHRDLAPPAAPVEIVEGDDAAPAAVDVVQVAPAADVGQQADVFVNIQERTPEEFNATLISERDHILSVMLGTVISGKLWTAYRASQETQAEMQLVMDVYRDANMSLVRHCKMTCVADIDADALACCWQGKFGAAFQEGNNAVRQNHLLNMFRVDVTTSCTMLLERENLRKAVNGLWPDHVHVVMEDWLAKRNLPLPAGEDPKSTNQEYLELTELTGLREAAIQRYQRVFKKKRFNLQTRQIEDRPVPADTSRRVLAKIHAGKAEANTIISYIQRFPHLKFKQLPKPEQEALCQELECTPDKMVGWYQRVRRREVQKGNININPNPNP